MADPIPRIPFLPPDKENFGFEVIPLGHFFSRKVKLICPLDQPHRSQFYQILYITRGQGRHYIDFRSHDYGPGSLLFISLGQVHAFDVSQKPQGFLVLFTETFLTRNLVHSDVLPFSRLYNYHLYPPDLRLGDDPVFTALFTELHDEYRSPESFAKEEMLRILLKRLLLKAERIKHTLTAGERNSEWLARFGEFRRLLDRHYPETRNADAYAAKMNISYHHLNHIVKAMTGQTAKSFIDQFVVLEIKRHLAVSDISVKALAYVTGFDEPTNFVKYFKKHTGQSPKRFRKEMTC